MEFEPPNKIARNDEDEKEDKVKSPIGKPNYDDLLEVFKFLSANEIEKCQLVHSTWNYVISTATGLMPLRMFEMLFVHGGPRYPIVQILKEASAGRYTNLFENWIPSLKKVVFKNIEVQYYTELSTDQIKSEFEKLCRLSGAKIRGNLFTGPKVKFDEEFCAGYSKILNDYVEIKEALFMVDRESIEILYSMPELLNLPLSNIRFGCCHYCDYQFELIEGLIEKAKFSNARILIYEGLNADFVYDMDEAIERTYEFCQTILKLFKHSEEPNKIISKFKIELGRVDTKGIEELFKKCMNKLHDNRAFMKEHGLLEWGNTWMEGCSYKRDDKWKIRIYCDQIALELNIHIYKFDDR